MLSDIYFKVKKEACIKGRKTPRALPCKNAARTLKRRFSGYGVLADVNFSWLDFLRHSPEAGWAGITALVIFHEYLARWDPLARLRWIYCLCISRQACPVWEHRSVRSIHPSSNFNSDDETGTQGIGVWSADVYWLHRHLLDDFVGQLVFNLLPIPSIPNHKHQWLKSPRVNANTSTNK